MRTVPDKLTTHLEHFNGKWFVFLSTFQTTKTERIEWANHPSIIPHTVRVIPYETEQQALEFVTYWNKQ